MANICWFELRIRGSKKNCYDMLTTDIETNCYEFDVMEERGTDDDYMMYISGECRWSVTDSLINVKEGQDTLADTAKKFQLELEICSIDESQEVQEHFHYKGSEMIKANNLPFAISFYTIEDGEFEISEEDLSKYNKREDMGYYVLKEEFQEKISFDEDTGEIEFDFSMSFDDLD